MARIAILGTGMMGTGFAQASLRRGDQVAVWNRNPARARPLADAGATVAETPTDAARGAERVHLVLSDDAAVDAVLAAARSGIGAGALVIDHTTVSPSGTVARAARCASDGIEFLHAPMFMAPKNAQDATGVMLVAGPSARVARARAALEAMTGRLWCVGERVDLAAVYKLLGNAMLITIVGGLDEVFRLGRAAGLSAGEAHALFSHFKPVSAIDVRGARMAKGDFTATFESTMARKDLRLMLELAATGGESLAILPHLAARLDEAIAAGFGASDMGVIARDALGPKP